MTANGQGIYDDAMIALAEVEENGCIHYQLEK